MSLDSIIQLAAGGGVAGIFCVLFITGYIFPRSVVSDLRTEIDQLKAERTAERERADAAVAAAEATKDVMRALLQSRGRVSTGDDP